ncbi:MAG TPA: leucine--tRNA ligase, partial [Candidatus Moranbacteria bacterium]|nr:leucine--tRNA ligase [Candidatus Moranbacteria bacterium]
IEDWVETTCPNCGGPAERETDTMPQWAGSSWYYLRYIDPRNDEKLVDPEKEKYWSPVDFYVGGMEHATRHLIYARFWHKFLYDIGVVAYEEPFAKLKTVGLIMAEDGRKMSKRWGNVINPDEVIDRFGTDTFRLYEMFMGPFEESIAWSTSGLVGPRKFLERIWKLAQTTPAERTDRELAAALARTIDKVGVDIEEIKYNTAIAAMMSFVNLWEKKRALAKEDLADFLKILSPFAPHIAQELWEIIGEEGLVLRAAWPEVNDDLLRETEKTVVVQINGKLRDTFSAPADLSDEKLRAAALDREKIRRHLEGKRPRKVIVVKNKLVNIVV